MLDSLSRKLVIARDEGIVYIRFTHFARWYGRVIAVSIKVNYRGLELTVDSLDQVDQLADRLAKVKTNGHLTPTSPRSPNGDASSVSAFVASLKDIQKRAVAILVDHKGEMLASDLCEKLDVSDNLSLAGRVLSPIARLAKSAGFTASIIRKMPSIDAKTKEYTLYYVIPPEIRDEVREGLKM